MGWKDNLLNISQPSINSSDYTTTSNIQDHIIDTTKESSGTWWLNYTSIALFVYSVYAFSKKNGFMQAIMISSYISFMVAISFILCTWSITIYPFFLFGMIWSVAVVIIYNSKVNNKI